VTTSRKTYNILVPYFTRSEHGPLEPLLKIAKQHPFDKMLKLWDVDARVYDKPGYYPEDGYGHSLVPEPDLVLCGFDRPEMAKYAYDAYHMGPPLPIAQIFAGDIAGGAYDDRDRFVISNYADLIFTAGRRQQSRVIEATRWRREVNELPIVICSGATHYDDMTVEEIPGMKLPKEFALVLYNRPSLLSMTETVDEVMELGKWLDNHGHPVYWAQPNGDEGSDKITNIARLFCETQMLPQMTRGEFLWILSKASIFVGNSSALCYEAPYFLRPIKQFGVRNKYREALEETQPGASACILTNIYNFLERRQ
jgi:UDP-N-acetylglucosamine 2-epimerase